MLQVLLLIRTWVPVGRDKGVLVGLFGLHAVSYNLLECPIS